VPITLSAVNAESEAGAGLGVCVAGVCAASGNAFAHNTNAHSTEMLPNFLMFFLWLKSQLISAQNQWFLALKGINTLGVVFVTGNYFSVEDRRRRVVVSAGGAWS
jgi:hypothetical protein